MGNYSDKMWNNGMFNPMRPGMPQMNQNWGQPPPNYQQQFTQWPMNQQWVPPGVPPGIPPGVPPGVPPIPFNNVAGWNQPRAPHNQYARPPNPPLPTRAPQPPQSKPPVPKPAPPSQPPPPKEQTAPPPPPPQEKGQPPPPPGIESPKGPGKE